MDDNKIYSDIAKRTGGDIYVGVVGPVRTGKSSFIKRFMDTLVIPNVEGVYQKERAIDELPQSAAGRTIMTTEPKFIPEDAVKINIDDTASLNVRMIDCVGYIVPSALGYIEDDQPRMVKTPWFEESIPFNMAAEIGTQKVITEHSTIGIMVTTDGSISDIPRAEYAEAEERVVSELKAINKPFVIILNCVNPVSDESQSLAAELENKYEIPVVAANCMELDERAIRYILSLVLFEFPVREIAVEMPKWLMSLDRSYWLRGDIVSSVKQSMQTISRVRDINAAAQALDGCNHIQSAAISSINLGTGCASINLTLEPDLFYKVLGEQTGIDIASENELLTSLIEMANIKKQYLKYQAAIDEVLQTGYGIVMPTIDELTLEPPEIVKRGGQYGIRLQASAPSIHMMRADISTEVAPIVGSEKQSEDLVVFLMREFEENPVKIWESNIFGKSLHELVNEGLHNKLYRMPADARLKVKETIERIINEGCNGLICIIL